VNEKKSRKLFVIVAWRAGDSVLNTGCYKVFAYDESVQCVGKSCALHPDEDLVKRFGIGFDGVRESELLTYKYKTAAAARRRLMEWGCR
jgi:hypothetical protein